MPGRRERNYHHELCGLCSAAFLVQKQLFLEVDYSPRATLEWHSFNLFIKVFYHKHGRVLKTADYNDFYVNHISHYDSAVLKSGHCGADINERLKIINATGTAAELECERSEVTRSFKSRTRSRELKLTVPLGSRASLSGNTGGEKRKDASTGNHGDLNTVIGLVPFWGGSAEESKGNAHSSASREVINDREFSPTSQEFVKRNIVVCGFLFS